MRGRPGALIPGYPEGPPQCRRQKRLGYIDTNTSNDARGMSILSLQAGFDVVGTYLDRGEHTKTLMQKELRPPQG